jgi:DNA-binding transcriptional MerR regulator
VNPERSPSGYRKFFEADVERLRWVLRQQREHFLPLKVIRDRLADGDINESESAPYEAAANGRASEPVHATAGAGAGAGSRGRARTVGSAAGSTATVEPPAQEPVTQAPSHRAGDDAMARILADASRRAGRVPVGAAEHISLEPAVPDMGAPLAASAAPVPEARPATTAEVEGGAEVAAASTTAHEPAATVEAANAARDVTDAATSATAPGALTQSTVPPQPPRSAAPIAPPPPPSMTRPQATAPIGEQRTTMTEAQGAVDAPAATSPKPSSLIRESPPVSAAAPTSRPPEAARQAGTAGPRAVQPEKRTPTGGKAGGAPSERTSSGGTEARSSSTVSIVSGASMTTEELCSASGLSEIELAGLQGFGLIEPVMVAGILTFDEDALTVANLAADFRKFGIEARHLRPYRNAVDREMGLIEQVIIPLLRQRNPESRQRAAAAADELGALGQTMRATLLRSALRRHVGG